MISRGTSSAPRRPQRSKSTPSFKTRAAKTSETNIDETETLHQDALTAANLAYERAKERKVAPKGTLREDGEHKASVVKPDLGRRQSVRFVGPNAVLTNSRSITRRDAPVYPISRQSQRHSLPSRPADISLLSTEASVTALPEDFGEIFIASEPSSYRRLRKAKSLFNPGKASSTIFSSRTRNSKRFQQHSLQSSDATGEPVRVPDPRLKRSFSFLRGATDTLAIDSRQYATQDAAIQLARDAYLRQVEQQRLKEQHSFLNIGKRSRTKKAFRRTVRTSSTTSYGSAVSSPLPSVEPKGPMALGIKARSISQTWKEKFRQVFKRSSNDQCIPVQHLDAVHAHYGDHKPGYHGPTKAFSPSAEPNAQLLRRVGSREFPLHSEPDIASKSPGSSSVRSLSSDDEETKDKSRVTSWTNSTAADTINLSNFMDRKRLSIIREDGGPHQSSISAQHINNLDGGYAVFRQPVKQGDASRAETRRIFSALQKEIYQNKRNATIDDGDSDTNSDSDRLSRHGSPAVPGRKSSGRPGVRHVNSAPQGTAGYPNWQGPNPFMPKLPEKLGIGYSSRQSAMPSPRSGYQQDDEDIQEGLTLQDIANLNESNSTASRRPLREVKSAFFPSSMRIERSNISPFRRAMYASNEDEDAAIRSEFVSQRAPIGSRTRSGSVARSESVYSRSSSDQTTKAAASSSSLAKTESCGKAGTAVIISSLPSPNQSSPYEPSARPIFPQRYSSANSSGDWRKFLASQVASLEHSERPHVSVQDTFEPKDRRHRKENAQLDGEDLKLRTLHPEYLPKQPLGIIQGNTLGRPRSMEDGVPSSKAHHAKAVTARENENNHMKPPSVSGQEHSKMETGFLSNGRVNNSPTGLHQRPSQATLNTQNLSNKTAAGQNARISPERAERLRRLKSSSSTTLRKMPSGEENQAVANLKDSSGHILDHLDTNPVVINTHAGKNHKLVTSFLKDRRSQMRISEESSNEPAFL